MLVEMLRLEIPHQYTLFLETFGRICTRFYEIFNRFFGKVFYNIGHSCIHHRKEVATMILPSKNGNGCEVILCGDLEPSQEDHFGERFALF